MFVSRRAPLHPELAIAGPGAALAASSGSIELAEGEEEDDEKDEKAEERGEGEGVAPSLCIIILKHLYDKHMDLAKEK